MTKLRTLLGNTNVQVLCGGLIRYTVMCLIIRFMRPWWLGLILYILLFLPFGLLFLWSIDAEPEKKDIPWLVLWTIIGGLISHTVGSMAFHFIGWFAAPAMAVGNAILFLYATDDEPRTKTSPSIEEAMNHDESDPVDGDAQDVPAGDDRPDPDGDPEDEKLQQYSGRYNWNTGEPIERKEAE